MSITDIKFTKFDNRPWGFRLVGGSDFPQPLTVIKVAEESLAECMGLKVGDLVVRLNDSTVSNLTHGQAHEALKLAGNNYTLGIYRKKEETVEEIEPVNGLPDDKLEPYQIPLEELEPVIPIPLEDPSHMICNPENGDNENKLIVSEYLEAVIESKIENENPPTEEKVVEEKPVDANSEIIPNKNLTDDEIAQLIIEEEELLLAKGDQTVLGVNFKKLRPRAPLLKESKVLEELQSIALEDPPVVQELKHQSTFLQKPARPIPVKKHGQDEGIVEESEGYKVVIKKQPKKSVTERLLQTGLLDPEVLKSPELPAYQDIKKCPTPEPNPNQSNEILNENNVNHINHVNAENENGDECRDKDEEKEQEESSQCANGESDRLINTQDDSSNLHMDENPEESSDSLNANELSSCNDSQSVIETPIFDKKKIQELVSTEISLEKQLENVQNQLLALKQLPSEIENHLKVVSEQLYKIMELSGVKNSSVTGSRRSSSDKECKAESPQKIEEDDSQLNSEDIDKSHSDSDRDDISIAETTSTAMSHQLPQVIIDEDQEEVEPPEFNELEVTLKSEDNRIKKCIASYETRVFKSRTPSPATSLESYEPDPNLSPQDQVIQELKHRGARKRSHDLWPQAKHLELTYGRRWRCPNDFFNDEMIAEVLSGQAEVIRGRALGVNFKKYEKAWLPNYDHLMNSSVYKMLHKMEKEPKSGIPARPSKVPAAEDIIERMNTPA